MEYSEGYSPEDKSLTLLKKKRSKKGKRFNDEQIKSLESIFKVENKLESKKKVEVARDLGLQPRQVSIWFQNRRARWKSKQIEQEYKQLKDGFDSLSMQFESLKKEKQSLLIQLERLNNLLESPNNDGHIKSKDSEDKDYNLKEKPPSSLNNEGLKQHETMQTNKNNEKKEEEQESFKFGDQYGDTSLASPEEWCNLHLGGLFNQSCGTSKWWDF